jgi:hypothetical protein
MGKVTMDAQDLVRGHYRGDDLEGAVLAALRGAGVDVDDLHPRDLAGLDQLHAGFGPATEHVLDEDRTAANAAAGPPPPGALSPGALFGPGFGERLCNNAAAAMAGTLGAVLMVARAA